MFVDIHRTYFLIVNRYLFPLPKFISLSGIAAACLLMLATSCSDNVPKTGQETQAATTPASDSVKPDWGENKIPAFEAYCKSMIPGAEVEVFELTWPGDDLLCDSYEGSEGEMVYRVYRLKDSKKVVYITEGGAYCQGDSEYSFAYRFGMDGYAVYSEHGGNDYVPTTINFYEGGKPSTEIAYSPAADGPPKRTIQKAAPGETATARQYEQKITEYRQRMQARANTLKSLKFKPDETDKKADAEALVKELEATLAQGISYQDVYVLRTAQPSEKSGDGEMTLINGTDVRVRTQPNLNAGVLAKVSYYNTDVMVIDQAPAETVAPFGTYPWYKIEYTDVVSHKEVQGWIFGAFLAVGVYPKIDANHPL